MLHEFWLILNFVKSLLIALINLIYKGESVCVCVSGIEIHIVGPILTKFGMGASLYRGQVIGYVSAPGLDPQGQWGPKQGPESVYSRNRETMKIFY